MILSTPICALVASGVLKWHQGRNCYMGKGDLVPCFVLLAPIGYASSCQGTHTRVSNLGIGWELLHGPLF